MRRTETRKGAAWQSLKSKLNSCLRNGEGYEQPHSSVLLWDLSSPRDAGIGPLHFHSSAKAPSSISAPQTFPQQYPTVLGPQNADVYLIKLIGCHLTKFHETRFSKSVPPGMQRLSSVKFSIPLVLFLHIQQVLIFFCHLAHLKVKKTETK